MLQPASTDNAKSSKESSREQAGESVEEIQTGELRLSAEAQSVLPDYEGKIERVLVKNGKLYCNYITAFNTSSILCIDIATGEKSFPYSLTRADIAATIKSTGMTYLRLDNSSNGPYEDYLLEFRTFAAKLNVSPEALRPFFPKENKATNKNFISTNDILEHGITLMPIPATAKLTTETIGGKYLFLSSNKQLDTDSNKLISLKISEPYLENGLLKIPNSELIFQLASKGAYLHNDKTILTLDPEGVVTEIDIRSAHKPVSKELGKLQFPKCHHLEVSGFSGIENGEILYVSAKLDNQEKLFAFDKKSFQLAGSVDNVIGPIACDESGNVLFVDKNKTLKMITTNLVSLTGKNIIARTSPNLAAMKGAEAALDSLSLPSSETQTAPQSALSEEGKQLLNIQERLFRKIGPEIEKCNTLSDVETLSARIGKVRERAEFTALPASFELVDTRLAAKKEEVAYPEFQRRIKQIEALLSGKSQDLPNARAELLELNQLRSNIVIRDQEKRLIIGKQITDLNTKLGGLNDQADAQAEKQILTSFGTLAEEIKTCATQDEVLAVVMEGTGSEIRDLISQIAKKETRVALEEKLNLFVDQKITELAEGLRTQQLVEAEARLKTRAEYQTLVKSFAKALQSVGDRKGLQELSNSAVVKAARKQIQKLPEEEREEAHSTLNRMILERGKVVDFSQHVNNLSHTKGFVKFGNVEFPRAGDFEILFEPKFVPIKGRSGFAELVWIDARGKEFRPEVQPIAVNATEQERNSLVAQTKDDANKFFMCMIPRPPTVRSNWVINKHYEGYLGELSELLLYQKKLQQGLVIIEGDAGAAKSALVQMFSALTNRPMNTFACNGQTEKEDLTYLYQYDPEKGTYRIDSGFIEALQTPNTVVLLEEINSLPTPVAKMLNTLFDFRRELYLPDGRVIKADPSVLMIALQNPQSYAGVNKLSKEFLSRALVMEMDYAKYKEGSKFLPYEAEMYSKYRPQLAELTQEQFYALWDNVVNNENSEIAKNVLTPARVAEIKGLKRLIDVANSARGAYRAYQREESTEPFEFIFSYREAEVIASLWNGTSPIENVISRIVLPKIADAVEKKAMSALISTKAQAAAAA